MRDLLLHLLPWGIHIIIVVQGTTGDALDGLLRAITFLGQFSLLLVLLPGFWCADKRAAMRLAVLCLISAYVNAALKEIWAIPRPSLVSDTVRSKVMVDGYAFPSGHAQLAATLWPALAFAFHRRWLTVLSVVSVILISFSRVYLGVHYPQDVFAGIIVGLLLVYLYAQLGPPLEAWLACQSLGTQLGLTIALSTLAAVLAQSRDALSAVSGALGAVVGYLLESRWLDFGSRPGSLARAGEVATGTAVLVVIYLALGAPFVLAEVPLLASGMRMVRYAALGLGGTLVSPWLFTRLGLAHRRA